MGIVVIKIPSRQKVQAQATACRRQMTIRLTHLSGVTIANWFTTPLWQDAIPGPLDLGYPMVFVMMQAIFHSTGWSAMSKLRWK